MDLIGPLTTTPRGNKYIITITDYFSKWAEAGPLPDKTAQGIAKFLYSMVSDSCIFFCLSTHSWTTSKYWLHTEGEVYNLEGSC